MVKGKVFSIGCDHAGYEMKEKLKKYLEENGNKVIDTMPEFKEELSYTEAALKTSKEVLKGNAMFGILMCGTGIGMSIASNRIKGIKGAILYSDFVAEYARKHNDANILVFGARTMSFEEIIKRIDIFFSYEFLAGKYARRNEPLDRLDKMV